MIKSIWELDPLQIIDVGPTHMFSYAAIYEMKR